MICEFTIPNTYKNLKNDHDKCPLTNNVSGPYAYNAQKSVHNYLSRTYSFFSKVFA